MSQNFRAGLLLTGAIWSAVGCVEPPPADPSPTGGPGTSPVLAVEPADLSFGEVSVGEHGEEVLTLSNVGDADLVIGGISLDPEVDPDGVFSLASPFDAATVQPGGSTTVTVVFSPTSVGESAGRAVITTNVESSPATWVDLSGLGVALISPTLEPGTASPTLEPGTASPTLEPGTASPTLEPGTASPTLEPGTASPTLEPGTASPTPAPTEPPPPADVDGDGFTPAQGDCDDGDATVYPGAPEGQDSDLDGTLEGDGLDNNCDGIVDEGTDLSDDDGDGFSEIEGDCDDDDVDLYPGAPEGPQGEGGLTADGVDNNCDGIVDDGTTAYDDDGDSFSEDNGDCDDDDATTWPGAPELGDGKDNDCDGAVDEDPDPIDDDQDGYSEYEGDCNDGNPNVHPGAPEGVDTDGDGVPEGNGVDDDCDGVIDDGTTARDDDRDGYTELRGDCDDADPTVYPGAPEGKDTNGDGVLEGDGKDNDCDGLVDEGTDATDDDGDGYTELQGDCSDRNDTIYPGAPEGEDLTGDGIPEGDGADNNCDGVKDEGTSFYDDDKDGKTELQGDCDDNNAAVKPGAPEGLDTNGDGTLEGDGLDNNCNTVVDEGTDAFDDDRDGYTELEGDCNDGKSTINPGVAELCGDGIDNDCSGGDLACEQADLDEDTYATSEGDCNDRNPTVHPGAAEGVDVTGDGIPDGNGVDDDCDGTTDEGTSAYDDDKDGYSEVQGDCDDADPGLNPGEAEGEDSNGDGTLEEDGIDNNCDGEIDEGTDAFDDDGDGVTDLEGDCDDGDEDVLPGAGEADVFGDPDGIDNDCDGIADEDFAQVGEILVSEVMAQPSSSAGRYVELVNRSSREIDVMGWTLRTGGGAWVLSPGASLVVEPGGVLLVAASADPSANGGLSPDVVAPALSLATTDTVQVGVPNRVVDQLSYGTGWPLGSATAMTLDLSAQKKGLNDAPAQWCAARAPYGSGDKGTPGEVNGLCPEIDHDLDGYTVDQGDCDDLCDIIHPLAAELIDTVDNNCDGVLAPAETPVEVALESAGFNDGDRAKIYVEGVPTGTNGYGYNLVVMDQDSGAVLDAKNFDTWRFTTTAQEMANYIAGIPAGRVVLLAVRANGTANMNEAAFAAIEGLGSALVRTLVGNDSFALVGKKGLSKGQAAERVVKTGVGTATAGCFRLATPVPLKVESAGYEDGNYVRFFVDEVQESVPTYRGITVVSVDEYTGEVLSTATFDTHCCNSNADALNYWIRDLPPGRIVLAGIKDEGVNQMTERGYIAMESIGSGQIRSVTYRSGWAIVGRKGAFQNNVIGEDYAPKNSGAAVVEDLDSCF